MSKYIRRQVVNCKCQFFFLLYLQLKKYVYISETFQSLGLYKHVNYVPNKSFPSNFYFLECPYERSRGWLLQHARRKGFGSNDFSESRLIRLFVPRLLSAYQGRISPDVTMGIGGRQSRVFRSGRRLVQCVLIFL